MSVRGWGDVWRALITNERGTAAACSACSRPAGSRPRPQSPRQSVTIRC